MRPAYLDKPFKKQPFKDGFIFDCIAKGLERSPEITKEDRDALRLQFPNANCSGSNNGNFELYAPRTEYRISKPFKNVFIVTVYERSNKKDTSRPYDKFFLFPAQQVG